LWQVSTRQGRYAEGVTLSGQGDIETPRGAAS